MKIADSIKIAAISDDGSTISQHFGLTGVESAVAPVTQEKAKQWAK